MNNTKISIIMNCHNGEKFLHKSLDSILRQSYKNWELIFWDNNSSDNSSKIINAVDDKRIKYFFSRKYENLYKARNLALEKASGNFISFLDTDDTWNEYFLEKNLREIKKNDCNLVYTKYFIKNEKNNKIYVNEKKDLPSGFLSKNLLKKNIVGINGVLIEKKVFDHQQFNPKYQIIGDYDFFVKISLQNKFHALQEPLITYRYHSENFTNKNMRLHVEEYKHWINENKNKFKSLYYLFIFNFNLLKLKLKLFLLNYKISN